MALLPLLSGLTEVSPGADPAAFTAGFRTAVLIAAGLLGVGGTLAAGTVRDTPAPLPARPRHCEVDGPPVQPAPTAAARSGPPDQ